MIDPWTHHSDKDVDRRYWAMRAERERTLAEQALDPGVAFAHRRLAEAYVQRLEAITEA